MKTTNANKAQKVSEEVMRLRKELNLKADAIVDNGYCVWVTAPEKGVLSGKLKAEGFAFSSKRGAWWRKSESASAPAKTAPSGQRPQTKKTTQPKAEKAQKPQAEKAQTPKAQKELPELPEDVKAILIHRLASRYVECACTIKGTWAWVSGEKTREYIETLKADGFRWSGKNKAWYTPNGIPEKFLTGADATPAPVQVKTAEPKAQKKASQEKTTPKKGGIVNLAQMLA